MKRILTTLSQKWPEYLLEILVITIGILGAFALNNWNERRKLQQDEGKIIAQLIDEYEANLQQLDSKIEMRRMMIRQAQDVLDFIDNPDTITYNELLSNLIFFFNDPTLDPINNDLLETGNLRILGNDSLKKLLADWETDFSALNEHEVGWQRQTQNIVYPYFIEIQVLRDLSMIMFQMPIYKEVWNTDDAQIEELVSNMGYSRNPHPVLEILSDPKLESIAVSVIGYNQAANFQAILLRKKMMKTLELLRDEIE